MPSNSPYYIIQDSTLIDTLFVHLAKGLEGARLPSWVPGFIPGSSVTQEFPHREAASNEFMYMETTVRDGGLHWHCFQHVDSRSVLWLICKADNSVTPFADGFDAVFLQPMGHYPQPQNWSEVAFAQAPTETDGEEPFTGRGVAKPLRKGKTQPQQFTRTIKNGPDPDMPGYLTRIIKVKTWVGRGYVMVDTPVRQNIRRSREATAATAADFETRGTPYGREVAAALRAAVAYTQGIDIADFVDWLTTDGDWWYAGFTNVGVYMKDGEPVWTADVAHRHFDEGTYKTQWKRETFSGRHEDGMWHYVRMTSEDIESPESPADTDTDTDTD